MRWERHVRSKQEVRNTLNMMVRNLKGRSYSEGLSAGGRIMLKWALQSYGAKVRAGSNNLGD
jgi:hypothetical protein